MRTSRLAPLLAALAVLAAPLRAEEPRASATAPGSGARPPAPAWEISLAPYLWAAGVEGTLDAERVSADIDVSFSDVWDALDAGALFAAEARRGRLGLGANLIYLKLSEDAERPAGPVLPMAPPGAFQVRSAIDTAIVELRPAWEALSLPLAGGAGVRRVALDLGPAARVLWLDEHLHVELRPGAPTGPFSRRFDESEAWIDLLVAARVRAQLGERIGFVLTGDYGGFDLGNASHRTWSLAGFLAWRLGAGLELAAGWRTLELERGPADVEMSGPLLGAVYRFRALTRGAAPRR